MDFGIVSYGSALGEPVAVKEVVSEYTDDTQRVLDYGYRTIHRCPPEVGLTDLAHSAATDALREAGIDAAELDLLVLATTDIAEYMYWDAAAHLQHKLGAENAEAVLISQGCIGSITGFDMLAGRFATHPEYRNALVVGANRTCEAYWNRMDTHSLLFSDGAAAAVATRGHDRCRWRATEAITDGQYADFFRMDRGGAANPFSASPPALGEDESPRVRDAWDMMEFFDYDPDRFSQFIDLMNDRVRTVVHRACQRTGIETTELAKLVLFNDNARTFTAIAEKFGMDMAQTNLEFSLDNGHFGAADHLLNLQNHAAELNPGDKVALAGMGRGMHWACTLLEI